jgi:hypothetical protein
MIPDSRIIANPTVEIGLWPDGAPLLARDPLAEARHELRGVAAHRSQGAGAVLRCGPLCAANPRKRPVFIVCVAFGSVVDDPPS